MSLEVLASFDRISERLNNLACKAPDWAPAQDSACYIARVHQKVSVVKNRMNSMLVVAALGGTGTGKSSLINALLGAEIVRSTPVRPTTMRPAMICLPEFQPENLNIPDELVEVIHVNSPLLKKIILIDCPDPDSVEQGNLEALRKILPFCDIILNVSTQQKYKNYRVMGELVDNSVGASLIWIQTHADQDVDIRDDWRRILSKDFNNVNRIFFVDSRRALACRQKGIEPDEEFVQLENLLANQLISGDGVNDIRRYQFLDIVDEELTRISQSLESKKEPLDELQAKINRVRESYIEDITQKRKEDLADNRLRWEQMIRDEIVCRWGASPFSFALQVYNRLDKIILGSLAFRARSFTQLAVVGVSEGARQLYKWSEQQKAEALLAAAGRFLWTDSKYLEEALKINGYARDAGIPETSEEELKQDAIKATEDFSLSAEEQLNEIVRQTGKEKGAFHIRAFYELIFLALIVVFAFRPAKNFFYDSLIMGRSLYGLDFYCISLIWFLAATAGLLLFFTWGTKRGVSRHLNELQQNLRKYFSASAILSNLQNNIDRAVCLC